MKRLNVGVTVRTFAGDASGATAIEYAMIAGGISILIIGGVGLIGTNLDAMFQAIGAMF